jgi:O-antigen/teichoic acid export membrane protein
VIAALLRLPDAMLAFRRQAAVRAVGVMAASSALGQLAIFCTLPLLTRLYDPAAFGLHALFMAAVGAASVTVCLCLEHRTVSTADDAEADNMFAAALMSVPVVALLSAAVLAALIGFNCFGYHRLPFWSVPLMAAMIGLNGVFSACRSRIVRQQDYTLIARTSLTQNIARALAPLLLFALFPFWFGLSAGELAGRSVGVRSLTQRVWQRCQGAAIWLHPREWWRMVRTEYRFTAVLTATVLVDALASQMISPLLASTYGAQAAGEYFVVAMIVVGPSALIGSAAADVIHAKGAELFHGAPTALPAFARKSALVLLGLGLAIFAPVYIVAPYVLPPFLGAKWPHVVDAVRALTPFAVVAFVASPCSRLLASINRPTIKVVSDVVRLTGVPSTLYWSHSAGADFVQAMWNLSWFLAAAYLLYFLLTYLTVSVVASKHT